MTEVEEIERRHNLALNAAKARRPLDWTPEEVRMHREGQNLAHEECRAKIEEYKCKRDYFEAEAGYDAVIDEQEARIQSLEAENRKFREVLREIEADDDEGHTMGNQRAQDQRWAHQALEPEATGEEE
jgi:hypothetical protein